jgi:hypothetical protein
LDHSENQGFIEIEKRINELLMNSDELKEIIKKPNGLAHEFKK